MWFLIIIFTIILIVIVKFTNDVKKQNAQVLSEGGMKNKYSLLIEYLKADKGQIMSERASSITVGMDNMDGGTRFILIQTFRRLTVQWKCTSIVWGNHQLEWEFDENLSQKIIYNKINDDLRIYQKNKIFRL
jgi:hypothetical protein